MILYRDDFTNSIQQNVIMLEVSEQPGGFVYLSQATYDQALLLNDRFEGELGLLKQILEVEDNHSDAITYFYDTAPEPISILAPFIGLIRDDVELGEDFEQLCGVLHVLSSTIDFNGFTKVHADIRVNVKFGRSTILNYKKSWDDIMRKITTDVIEHELLEELSNIMFSCTHEVGKILKDFLTNLFPNGSLAVQSVYTQPYSVHAAGVATPVEEEEFKESEEDIWAQLGRIMEEEVASREKAKEDEKKQGTVIDHSVAAEPKVVEATINEEEKKIDDIIKKFGGVK